MTGPRASTYRTIRVLFSNPIVQSVLLDPGVNYFGVPEVVECGDREGGGGGEARSARGARVVGAGVGNGPTPGADGGMGGRVGPAGPTGGYRAALGQGEKPNREKPEGSH